MIIVIVMDRVPQQPVKDPPNLIRSGSFSLKRLLSHIDPGPPEESEAFVQAIYEQRRIDASSDCNGKNAGGDAPGRAGRQMSSADAWIAATALVLSAPQVVSATAG